MDRQSGWIAVIGGRGNLWVARPDGWAKPTRLSGFGGPALAIAPGGARLAVQAQGGSVRVLSLDGLSELNRIQASGSYRMCLAFLDPDSLLIASTTGSGTMDASWLERWDLGSSSPTWRTELVGGATSLRADPPTGRAVIGLITGDLHQVRGRELQWFEPQAERVLSERLGFLDYVPTHGASVRDVAFRGSLLVAVAARKRAVSLGDARQQQRDSRSVWELDSGRELDFESGYPRYGIDFVPETDFLVEAAADGVRLHRAPWSTD